MKKLIFALTCLFLAIPCTARTITVKADGSGDYPTIQAAINDANNGDVVEVQPGTYTGNGNRDIDFLGKAITVRSIDPNDPCVVAATIIDCNGSATEPHRGFYFHSGEDANSVLTGLTITNGYASDGGGIYCYSNPTIRNCIFTDNAASDDGGGIHSYNCSPIITNCLFTRNTAIDFGGGIYPSHGRPKIANCIFAYNSAGRGGGILYQSSKDTDIKNSIFINNSASIGGGICYQASQSYNMFITNCTFFGNSGGAVYLYWSTATMTNCILWDNPGADIRLTDSSYNSALTISYTDIQGGLSGVYQESGCSLNWGAGNINADPCFVDLVGGDYHILFDSPCIDSGDPQFVPQQGEVDIDGEPRVMGYRVDIGADEFNHVTPIFGISPKEFKFYVREDGPDPEAHVLSVRNMSGGTLKWEITYDCNWLTVDPVSGSSTGEPNEVTLSVDITGLSWGIYDCNLIISDPCALNNPQMVNVGLIIECFPADHPDYSVWVNVGRPPCWCYPRQCHGDSDNTVEYMAKKGSYYCHFNDLNLLLAAWYVREPPEGPGIKWPNPRICADFGHDKEIAHVKNWYYRVHFRDLSILLTYWNVREPPDGPGIEPNCLDVP